MPSDRKSSHEKRSLKSAKAAGRKRARTEGGTPSSSRRRIISGDALQWRPVKTSAMAGMDAGGGMMMLEELDDVGVEWEEEGEGRRTARFVVAEGSKRSKGKGKHVVDDMLEEQAAEVAQAESGEEGEQAEEEDEDENELPTFAGLDKEDLDEEDDEDDVNSEAGFDDDLLPEWSDIPLHATLKRSLLAARFVAPTEIQKRSLPAGLSGRDVVGVAETGSGKTLAYSLPILSHLLRSPRHSSFTRRPLSALILCPTRELALQVVEHIQAVLKHSFPAEEGDEKKKQKGPPRVSVGSVVGGLSAQKQKRIVERGCDALVATPGRLWDLLKSDEDLAASVRGLRFLVIDEADRMIENGHFVELESIVRLTQRSLGQTSGPDDDDPVFANASGALDFEARADMQSFVFSATMSKDLQQNLKRRSRGPGKKGARKATALEDLVERLDFRDANPEVIDLSPEGGVVKQLRESMIECITTDKDLYLYYFLLRYPGRTLVFTNSIDGIRRLIPLFETLQMPVWPLHSQLQQKQRLKNLERFKSTPNSCLIATDVASRGLDIPQVDHVVHFNLPRTADAYIHRSGRTARAANEGFALQIVSAEDKAPQRALMKSLGRSLDLPELPIESGFMPRLKERVSLAREIEKAQHEVKKEKHDRNWLEEAAEALDVDIDPSMLSERDEDDDRRIKKTKNGQYKRSLNVPALKAELKALLREPLVARGVSARYPTSGSKVIVDDLLTSTGHPTMLGVGKTRAYDEVHSVRKRVGDKRKRGKGGA